MNARAELARKVARMWEEQLADPREAADAWRRVLRMKQGDPEATAGLERAKSNMLKKPEPGAEREAYAPPKLVSSPPAASASAPPPPVAAGPPQAEQSSPRTDRLEDRQTPQPPPGEIEQLRVQSFPDDAAWGSQPAVPVAEPASDEQSAEEGADGEVEPIQPVRRRDVFGPVSGLSVGTPAPPGAPTEAELDRATRPAGDEDIAVLEQTFPPRDADEMMRTTERASGEFLDSPLARPPKLAPGFAGAPPPAGTAEASGEYIDLSVSGESVAVSEEEVVIADDLAEMIDVEEEPGPETEESPEDKKETASPSTKRSVPPPFPRT